MLNATTTRIVKDEKNNIKSKSIKGIRFFNKTITYSDIALGAFLLIIAIFGIRSYIYKKEKLSSKTTIVIGKVIWVGQSAGKRVCQCEIKCYYTFKSKSYQRNFECKGLAVDVGDCLEIIQSLEDDNVSQINYSKGKVNCE